MILFLYHLRVQNVVQTEQVMKSTKLFTLNYNSQLTTKQNDRQLWLICVGGLKLGILDKSG